MRGTSLKLATVGVLVSLVALAGCTKYGGTLDRPDDPVVFQAGAIPGLTTLALQPKQVVAFAWDGSAWHQIPVQVDERDLRNPGQIYHRPGSLWAALPSGDPFEFLVYTDPVDPGPGYTSWDTYTGPDTNLLVDANDEVTFMANDSGKQAPPSAGNPAGVVTAKRAEVKVTDPAAAGEGYVYLYKGTTLRGGSAGTTGVSYQFSLDSGDYKNTYGMGNGAIAPNDHKGPNPEHSTVTTPDYTQSYADRWLNDSLRITRGGADGTDVLERGRFQLVPGFCGRSEDTFDAAEGAFIANISGPVRAIRSYMGANSGQYTTTTDVFYSSREDSVTDLRLHVISGVMGFDDLTTGLDGLTYSDPQTAGVPVDGSPDSVGTTSAPAWQMVSGNAGSLVTARSVTTDIAGPAVSTYYLDQSPASPKPCTGDLAAWGQNGVQVTGPGGGVLPCTDPTRYGELGACPTVNGQPTANTFSASRVRYLQPPGVGAQVAATLANRANTPPAITVTLQ